MLGLLIAGAPWLLVAFAPCLLVAFAPCCPLDRADDVLIAGAAADLAGDRLPDVGLTGIRDAVEQPPGGQHHARRAEAALQTVAGGEPLLHWVEPGAAGESLDCRDPPAVGRHGQHRARLD